MMNYTQSLFIYKLLMSYPCNNLLTVIPNQLPYSTTYKDNGTLYRGTGWYLPSKNHALHKLSYGCKSAMYMEWYDE